MRECEGAIAKILDEGDAIVPPGTLRVNRSGRVRLKRGADVAVGKWTTRKTEQLQEVVATTAI
jgi:hypothetical protein